MIAIDPVFNELAAEQVTFNEDGARRHMGNALTVLLEMPNHGIGSGLRISDRFYQLEMAPDYSMTDWINDNQVDRDQLRFFLGLAAKAPFLRQEDSPAALERLEDSEVRCNDSAHAAFLAAYVLDAPLVSFDHSHWKAPELAAEVIQLDEEATFIHEAVSLINFSQLAHFDHHKGWLTKRSAARDAADLWNRRSSLFPHLQFSPQVEWQLHEHEAILAHVVKRLSDLERVAASSKSIRADAFNQKCSSTSQATFERFGGAYDFVAPDGTKTRCGWHFYLPDGRRIYFSSTFLVGHIGPHLPTAKFH